MIYDAKWMLLSLHLLINFINTSDCEVLFDVLEGLKIPFENTTNCCTIQGITCNGKSITKITLTTGGVGNGTIPESIGNLTELKSLTISAGIIGQVPCSLSNLPKLEALNLSNNINLSGLVYDNDVRKNISLDSTNISNCFIDRSKECIDRTLCPTPTPPTPPRPSTQQTEEQRKVESIYWLIPFFLTLVFSVLVVYFVYTKKNKGNPSMENKAKLENKGKLATIGRPPKLPKKLPPTPEQSQFPPAPEQSQFPPAPEQSQFPPAPEQSQFPLAPGQSQFPLAPGQSQFPLAPGQSQWHSSYTAFDPNSTRSSGARLSQIVSIAKADQECKKPPQESNKSQPTKNDGLSPTKILAMCSY